MASWWVGPPVVGGPNQYQVVQARTAADAARLKGYGYKGPYPTQAAAQAAATGATKRATSTEIPTQAQGSPGGSSAACALHFPGIAGVGSFCIVSKTALRALIGGLVLGGAGAIGITAAVVLAAYGLGHTKSGQALKQSAGAVAKAGAAAGIIE